jgi:hypothetical protein
LARIVAGAGKTTTSVRPQDGHTRCFNALSVFFRGGDLPPPLFDDVAMEHTG